MLGTINPEILFLQQEDQIKAGLLDMKMILKITEDTYKMLGQGQIQNPPKVHLGIPEGTEWESFFNTMPSYIGGDMNIAGIKWAAESKKNATTPGIPYGIDISILSDPVTVLPFCIQDGTIITAMRTSAVAGLQAKYCAPSDTDTATLIGAGVIGRTMIMAICEAIPTVKTIYLCDLDLEKAEQVAKESEGKYGVTIIPTSDSKAAAAKSQLIVGETTARTPFIDKSWVKPHSAIVCVSNEATTDVVKAADVNVVDYWKQIITFKNKAITQVFDAGEITKEEVLETSDLVLGKPCRTSDEQFIYACSLGLGALDITVAYALYQNAVKMGLGTKVKLWDKPLWEYTPRSKTRRGETIMKKASALLLALVTLLSLTACAGKEDAASSALDQIKQKGELVVGTSADYPPYEFHAEVDGKDTIVGFDMEIAQAIADKLGVSMKIVDMSFDNLLMSLANDEFDLVIAGLSADEERRKTTDFSDPYLEAKNLILVRAEDADKYASLDDLKGVKGGAQTGSKPYNNCVTYCGEEATVGLAKVQDLVMELEAGKLDVVFLDYMTVLSYADAKEDLAAVDLGIPETSDGYSIAVKKGNTELAEFINGVLAELKEQNAIEQFIVEAKKLESAAE